ncbi:hypothetical protein [Paraclostridium bifermentans]|uniref:hypothetical protein n=1 Tax=Paraclostridium bifermentans TaxID=1490 RepID=UPI00374F957F
MKLSQIYSEFFTNWLTDGFFINKDKISSVGIKPGFDRIFTKGYIRKIWVVEKIPVRYERNLVEALRDNMFEELPNCKTYVNILNCPTTIQTNSDTFKRSMHKAEDDYSAYKEVFEKLTGTEKVVGKDIRVSSSKKITIKKSRLEKYKNTYDSYEYVYRGITSGMTFSKSTIVIEALCPDERSMRAYKKEMNCFLRNNEIEFKEMRGTISKFLTNYGISSYMQKGSRQSGVLFSDENLAGCSPYRNRGLVGGGGLLLGIDWKTKLPFLVNFFESGAGQILMLLARTGSGKTFVAFQMCLSLIAEGVHCSVIDIKGNEWIKLKRFIDKVESRKGKTARKAKVLYFAMGSTSSRFVNTLRLDDVTPDKKDCKEFYNMAVSGTINILSIMTNLQPGEGNIIDLENILEQAIGKLYSKYGVFNDRPETFAKTKGIRYEEIVPIITELQNSTSYTDEQRKMCKLICSRCSNFLQAEGKYSEAFKNEITLGEVLDSDLVIYSFGKNENQLLDSMDSLRVFMVQFLDTK